MRFLQRSARGFTLVELLIVIGIIAVLVGLLLPAIGSARKQSKVVRSLSDMRQMMTGYTAYHLNNKGRLLLGYPPASLAGGPGVYDPRNNATYTGASAGLVMIRYPWRLLPYVGNLWEILHSHEDLPPLPAAGDSDATALVKAYELSVFPTYGLNATYVGGDVGTLGFIEVPPGSGIFRPNVGKHVVFRANEVRRPSELIVFSDARSATAGSEGFGAFRLTPSRTSTQMWRVEGENIVRVDTASAMGIPKGWYTNRAVVGFFDGHAQAMLPSELEDMRLWANDAKTRDYQFPLP